MRGRNDTRTIGAKVADAIAGSARRVADLLLFCVILAFSIGVPVGTIYVAVHFIRRYW